MSTPGFLEIQLDPLLDWGTKGGLSYNTTVVAGIAHGPESRFPMQSRGYWKLSINLTTKSKNAMKVISAHFAAAQGKAWGWRFRNLREYFTSTDNGQTFASESLPLYTSGTTMQLYHQRVYAGRTETVPIRKPDMNSAGGTTGTGATPFHLYRDGSSTPWPSSGNWSLDVTTGIVTFNTNQVGHTFAWDGYWDTPMRFDVDDQTAAWSDFDVMDWDSINILEVPV
jgi:hypothetical protein